MFQELKVWMVRHGSHVSRVEVKQMGSDRGVVVAEGVKLQSGHCIIDVPLALIVTNTVVQQSSIGQEVKQSGFKSRTMYPFFACFLLCETFEHKLASPWYRWIVTLPTVQQAQQLYPLCFTEAKTNTLAGMECANNVKKQQARDKAEYRSLCSTVPDFADRFSLEQYRWARSIVSTRSYGIRIDGTFTTALIPLADMFNHDPRAQATWSYNQETHSFQLNAKGTLRTGQPITINYGSKSNARLFANYGFSIPNNDEVKIPLTDKARISLGNHTAYRDVLIPIRACILGTQNWKHRVESRLQKKKIKGLRRYFSFSSEAEPSRSASGAAWSVCSCEANRLCSFCIGHHHKHLTRGIDRESERKALHLLLQLCQQRAEQYDAAFPSQCSPSVLVQRQRELDLLQHYIAFAQDMLEATSAKKVAHLGARRKAYVSESILFG